MEGRKSFLLRIDPRLWRELESWAQEELRSVNGQIEYILKLAAEQKRKKAIQLRDRGSLGRRKDLK